MAHIIGVTSRGYLIVTFSSYNYNTKKCFLFFLKAAKIVNVVWDGRIRGLCLHLNNSSTLRHIDNAFILVHDRAVNINFIL